MRVLPIVVAIAGVTLAPAAPRRQAAPATAARTAVQHYLDQWRAAATFAGVSAGVVLPDGTAMAFASGLADRAAGTPLQPDDLLMAGSTGKTFFAALAMQLIGDGRLDLDAPVAKYLGDRPWYRRLPNAPDITIRQLMTHTSGLVRYEMNPRFTADLRAAPDKVWAPEEQLSYLFDATPPFAAGEGWDYSDTNYIVLGLVLEQLTGTPRLYDEIQRRWLGPLGLAGIVPAAGRRIPGLVQGYAGPRDPLGLPDEVIVDGAFVVNPQFEWTGGGYATSAGDLARWGHALYTGRVIEPALVKLMVESGVPARLGPETRYGLGVIIRPASPVGPVLGHSGFFPGYQTELVHAVNSRVTVALQINSSAPRSTGDRSLVRAAYDIVDLVR